MSTINRNLTQSLQINSKRLQNKPWQNVMARESITVTSQCYMQALS